MSELSFDTAPVPAQVFTKVAEPNPFAEQVKALAASVTKDGRSTVASTVVVPDDDVKKRVQQIRDAGAEAGVTARKKVEEVGDGTSVITFWTTPRITRPRKPKGEDGQAVAETDE